MANLDWFKGNTFHSVIRVVARDLESKHKIEFSGFGLDFVIEKYEENKEKNYLTENVKSSPNQRTVEDAAYSVNLLLEDAIRFARNQKRDFVKRDDIERAYLKNYCGIWPLCEGR